jgi:hypothetical protein
VGVALVVGMTSTTDPLNGKNKKSCNSVQIQALLLSNPDINDHSYFCRKATSLARARPFDKSSLMTASQIRWPLKKKGVPSCIDQSVTQDICQGTGLYEVGTDK